MTSTKYIFIDRDGVINKDLWKYVEVWDEFEFIPGVLDALKRLTESDYRVIILSNQAGIGDGIFTAEALGDINAHMIAAIEAYGGSVAGTYFCIHRKDEGCSCRKPQIGLFEHALRDFPDIGKQGVYFIGDKLSDIQAGKNFGVRTILTLTGYGARDQNQLTDALKPDYIARDLSDAVKYVLNNEQRVDDAQRGTKKDRHDTI